MNGGQLSLFDADLSAPHPYQLEGLLAGAGQVVRMGGTARVSIVVEDQWRVDALLAAFADRGVRGEQVVTVEGHLGVRTAFSAVLSPLATRWLRGAIKAPPAGFSLDGPRLRLWAIAGGRYDQSSFQLRLGESDHGCWEPIGGALSGAGLPAVLLGPRAGGPAYRIIGRRRLRRLAELIGGRPAAAPAEEWPPR